MIFPPKGSFGMCSEINSGNLFLSVLPGYTIKSSPDIFVVIVTLNHNQMCKKAENKYILGNKTLPVSIMSISAGSSNDISIKATRKVYKKECRVKFGVTCSSNSNDSHLWPGMITLSQLKNDCCGWLDTAGSDRRRLARARNGGVLCRSVSQ